MNGRRALKIATNNYLYETNHHSFGIGTDAVNGFSGQSTNTR